jgi:hypothetical protein
MMFAIKSIHRRVKGEDNLEVEASTANGSLRRLKTVSRLDCREVLLNQLLERRERGLDKIRPTSHPRPQY